MMQLVEYYGKQYLGNTDISGKQYVLIGRSVDDCFLGVITENVKVLQEQVDWQELGSHIRFACTIANEARALSELDLLHQVVFYKCMSAEERATLMDSVFFTAWARGKSAWFSRLRMSGKASAERK